MNVGSRELTPLGPLETTTSPEQKLFDETCAALRSLISERRRISQEIFNHDGTSTDIQAEQAIETRYRTQVELLKLDPLLGEFGGRLYAYLYKRPNDFRVLSDPYFSMFDDPWKRGVFQIDQAKNWFQFQFDGYIYTRLVSLSLRVWDGDPDRNLEKLQTLLDALRTSDSADARVIFMRRATSLLVDATSRFNPNADGFVRLPEKISQLSPKHQLDYLEVAVPSIAAHLRIQYNNGSDIQKLNWTDYIELMGCLTLLFNLRKNPPKSTGETAEETIDKIDQTIFSGFSSYPEAFTNPSIMKHAVLDLQVIPHHLKGEIGEIAEKYFNSLPEAMTAFDEHRIAQLRPMIPLLGRRHAFTAVSLPKHLRIALLYPEFRKYGFDDGWLVDKNTNIENVVKWLKAWSGPTYDPNRGYILESAEPTFDATARAISAARHVSSANQESGLDNRHSRADGASYSGNFHLQENKTAEWLWSAASAGLFVVAIAVLLAVFLRETTFVVRGIGLLVSAIFGWSSWKSFFAGRTLHADDEAVKFMKQWLALENPAGLSAAQFENRQEEIKEKLKSFGLEAVKHVEVVDDLGGAGRAEAQTTDDGTLRLSAWLALLVLSDTGSKKFLQDRDYVLNAVLYNEKWRIHHSHLSSSQQTRRIYFLKPFRSKSKLNVGSRDMNKALGWNNLSVSVLVVIAAVAIGLGVAIFYLWGNAEWIERLFVMTTPPGRLQRLFMVVGGAGVLSMIASDNRSFNEPLRISALKAARDLESMVENLKANDLMDHGQFLHELNLFLSDIVGALEDNSEFSTWNNTLLDDLPTLQKKLRAAFKGQPEEKIACKRIDDNFWDILRYASFIRHRLAAGGSGSKRKSRILLAPAVKKFAAQSDKTRAKAMKLAVELGNAAVATILNALAQPALFGWGLFSSVRKSVKNTDELKRVFGNAGMGDYQFLDIFPYTLELIGLHYPQQLKDMKVQFLENPGTFFDSLKSESLPQEQFYLSVAQLTYDRLKKIGIPANQIAIFDTGAIDAVAYDTTEVNQIIENALKMSFVDMLHYYAATSWNVVFNFSPHLYIQLDKAMNRVQDRIGPIVRFMNEMERAGHSFESVEGLMAYLKNQAGHSPVILSDHNDELVYALTLPASAKASDAPDIWIKRIANGDVRVRLDDKAQFASQRESGLRSQYSNEAAALVEQALHFDGANPAIAQIQINVMAQSMRLGVDGQSRDENYLRHLAEAVSLELKALPTEDANRVVRVLRPLFVVADQNGDAPENLDPISFSTVDQAKHPGTVFELLSDDVSSARQEAKEALVLYDREQGAPHGVQLVFQSHNPDVEEMLNKEFKSRLAGEDIHLAKAATANAYELLKATYPGLTEDQWFNSVMWHLNTFHLHNLNLPSDFFQLPKAAPPDLSPERWKELADRFKIYLAVSQALAIRWNRFLLPSLAEFTQILVAA